MDDFLSTIGFPDDSVRHEFVSLFTKQKLAAGEVLFHCNEPAEKFYFLNEGHLGVHKYTGFLEKMQMIAILDPGAVVGEAALLQYHARNTRVTAIVESRLSCLERKDFSSFQKQFPESAFCFLEYLFSIASLRLEKTSERLARIL